MAKNPLVNAGDAMRVQSLDWEDPLEKESQPTVVFLPGKFRGQRSLVCYNPGGLKVVNQDSATDHTHTHTHTHSTANLFFISVLKLNFRTPNTV